MYTPYLHMPLRERLHKRTRSLQDPHFLPFAYRFHANLTGIKKLFDRLYGHRPDAETHFWALVDDLFEAFEDRATDLRDQDLAREAKPDWLLSEKRMGMMLYTDRFAGDLQAFQAKIPYLEELGVNWIHLMPLLASPPGNNDGGYAVSDYRAVDPALGDLASLKETARLLRQRGMLLTLDMVLNHTSDQHAWAQAARAGDQHYQDYYYFFENRWLPNQYEEVMPEVFPQSAPGNFTYLSELDRWVMTVFHSYQWDLNYTNPAVFREMLKILLFLANLGVDILRLDAVAFTWKQIGTTSQNLPEAHLILQLMKACCKVVAPGVAFIAEAIVAPHEVIRYFGEGEAQTHECEIAYHATFMALLWDALATGETQLLKMGLKGVPDKPYGTTWINYLRCHDDIGLGFDEQDLYALGKHPMSHKQFLVDFYRGNFPGSIATGAPFMFNPKTGDARISGSMAALTGLEWAEKHQDEGAIEMALRKICMLHAVIFAYGGLPLLYYGDEVGTPNDHSYLDNPTQAYDNRWMHRPIINWKRIGKRNEAGSLEQRLFRHIQTLILLRKASPEFADYNTTNVEQPQNPHLFAFMRWHPEGARTLVIANFNVGQQQEPLGFLHQCGFDPAHVVDKISGHPPTMQTGSVVLAPYQCYWLTDDSTFGAFQQAEEMQALQQLDWGTQGTGSL